MLHFVSLLNHVKRLDLLLDRRYINALIVIIIIIFIIIIIVKYNTDHVCICSIFDL